MARNVESPYPANAIFGVRKGFKAGIYDDYRAFLAQTVDYPGGKELWAVFTDRQHAQAYVASGICPVPPLGEKKAPGTFPIPSSVQSLPTPDTSPDHENAPSSLRTRQNASSSVPLYPNASQPPPAPRKPPTAQPEEDSGGDTEPEEDFKPPSASLPIQGAIRTPQNPPLRRPYKSGSITEALKRHASMNGSSLPSTQVTSTSKATAPVDLNPFSSSAPVASGSKSRRQTYPSPSKASGSSTFSVPEPISPPASAPVPVPVSAPSLVPELQRRPRPRGEYEQCAHCDGHGWILTPARPTSPVPPPRPAIVQTPSRPRATPTTNLRILSASESDSGGGSQAKKLQNPSGSRLRVLSVGGVGPERTPKRDSKRTVSDTVAGRRSRVVSDSTKGKGKERAIEMDIDEPSPESSPSAYDYM
ncbi:unnamed protein product [Rhizoctonia solani]|uniref:Uncharacterized protein n=1 Tax=Rhizoctonia solani TaxID=456999 RepID=A0A8H3B2D7_9AGAM|nr:unnamed protein product [Rhizoctonia solani]